MSVTPATPAPKRPWLKWSIGLGLAALAIGLAAWPQLGARREAAPSSFKVVGAYPHDPSAFTQGLAVEAGHLYEGTGQYGASTVRRVDLTTGSPEKQRALNPRYFGEG